MTAAEGRCSGELCWYTLPLVDGLVVPHSKSGVLDVCEGGGRPPLTAAAPDPSFCDRIEDAVVQSVGTQMPRGKVWRPGPVIDALLPLIAAEVEAHVQAAVDRRVAEELRAVADGYWRST